MAIKTVTILVSRVGNTHKLQLNDSEGNAGIDDAMKSTANDGDHIIWKLKENSGLDGLHAVKFPGEPARPADKDGMQIRVDIATLDKRTANYEIGYYADGKPEIVWEDPKIKLNF